MKPWPKSKPAMLASKRHTGPVDTAKIVTIEVGSRGLLHRAGFKELYSLVKANTAERNALEMEVIKRAVVRSYHILC